MSRIFLDSSLKIFPQDQLRAGIETLFQQLEDQINGGTDVVSLTDTDQSLPEGMKRGDIVFNIQRGELKVGVYNGESVFYASFGSFAGAITDAQHGTRAGGNLHPDATTIVSGFMSGADKTKSDRYKGDTTAAGPASLTEYPTNGDWGFHTDTVGVTYKLAKNKGGTIFTALLT